MIVQRCNVIVYVREFDFTMEAVEKMEGPIGSPGISICAIFW